MITYRSWQAGDFPWLTRAATAANWEGLTAEEQGEVDPAGLQQMSLDQLQEVLGNGTGNAVIAEEDGRPIGFALGVVAPDTSTGDSNGLLLNLWVDPSRRRQGVARGLLQVTEALFRCCGVHKAKLWTPLQNQAVVRLGERCGYVREGVINRKEFD
jgi:GNAT superfamily N-acetyltransferase